MSQLRCRVIEELLDDPDERQRLALLLLKELVTTHLWMV